MILFIMQYSLLGAAGSVLKTEEIQTSSDNLEPPAPGGCPPGCVGKVPLPWYSNDPQINESWVKTDIKLKAVVFSRE